MSQILKDIHSVDQDPKKVANEFTSNPFSIPQRHPSLMSKRVTIIVLLSLIFMAGVTLLFYFYKKKRESAVQMHNDQPSQLMNHSNQILALNNENQKGLQLYYNGNTDEAIRHFEGLLTNTPDQMSLMINLASTYTKKGEFQKAEELLKKVIEKEPTHAVALNNLAAIKRKNRDLTAAEELYRKGVLIMNHDPKIDLNLATLLEQNRMWSDALTHYKAYLANAHSVDDPQTKLKVEHRIRKINSLFHSKNKETTP